MNAFSVWIDRMDGATRLRVEGHDHATWLMRRLSEFFVFKTSEPVLDIPNSLECTFRIAHSSELSGSRFERLLAGISEVQLKREPARAAFGADTIQTSSRTYLAPTRSIA
jgi:hypothetical protein